MPRRRNLKLFLPSWTFHVTHHGSFAVIEQGSQRFFHADGLVKFPVFLWRYGEVVISLSWSQDRVCDQAVFLWNAKFSPLPAAFGLPRNTRNTWPQVTIHEEKQCTLFWKNNYYLKEFVYLFIVLFAINCTNQIKSNYLNSHGEEAQEKPPGL